jgi:hypothetical protein
MLLTNNHRCVIFRIRARVKHVAQYLPFDDRSTQSAHQRSLATTLYGLHRSMYMGEKESYYARCVEAMRDPEHAMSINTDGMDQFKTSIPKNIGDIYTSIRTTLTRRY